MRSKADETLVIVETLICPLKKKMFFLVHSKKILDGIILRSSPMDCHLNVMGRFEFSMILRAMPSVVFNHFHQGHPWR